MCFSFILLKEVFQGLKQWNSFRLIFCWSSRLSSALVGCMWFDTERVWRFLVLNNLLVIFLIIRTVVWSIKCQKMSKWNLISVFQSPRWRPQMSSIVLNTKIFSLPFYRRGKKPVKKITFKELESENTDHFFFEKRTQNDRSSIEIVCWLFNWWQLID